MLEKTLKKFINDKQYYQSIKQNFAKQQPYCFNDELKKILNQLLIKTLTT